MRIIPFMYNDVDDICANTYVVIDSRNRCVIIDPSKDNDSIIHYVVKNDLTPVGILLTHGSFDDAPFLGDSYLNCSKMMGAETTLDVKTIELIDGEVIKLLDEDIVALATPYHTIGSMCFHLKESKVLFTGDSLFLGTIGRSDLPTGNRKQIFTSLAKIFSLDLSTECYPGHGLRTVLKNEENIIKFVKGI